MLELSPAGRRVAAELTAIWKALGEAQRRRFAAAGCDIMAVMERVEDGLVAKSLSSEVLERVPAGRARKPARAKQPGNRRAGAGRRAARAVCLAAGMALAGVANAQNPEVRAPSIGKPPAIDAAARAALVNALADSLAAGYIYEKTGRMLADSLRAELRAGAYNGLETGEALAQRVNATLKRIANDRHLGVQYLAPSVPGQPAPMRRRVPPGGQASAAPREIPAPVSRVLSFPDLGIATAQIIPGNIGYLDLPGFSGDAAATGAIDSVMALFENTKAIIIDVGRNRGGGPLVIQHLSAYLFDRPTHLVSTFMRGMDAPRERWTAEKVSGRRLPNTPVYILTSGATISAAESFAFGLRNHKRATIVGERTAGGGHFGGFVQLTPGFSVFLPRGRTFNPATNEGWEAEGLAPDVAVPYERALDTAIELASRKSAQ
jgi:hypothetical protein